MQKGSKYQGISYDEIEEIFNPVLTIDELRTKSNERQKITYDNSFNNDKLKKAFHNCNFSLKEAEKTSTLVTTIKGILNQNKDKKNNSLTKILVLLTACCFNEKFLKVVVETFGNENLTNENLSDLLTKINELLITDKEIFNRAILINVKIK